jgi:ribosomal protein L34
VGTRKTGSGFLWRMFIKKSGENGRELVKIRCKS